MTRTIHFHELAELELNDDFYDSRKIGLGREFVREVQKAATQLGKYPESAPLIRGQVRRKVVGRFPYNIIYLVTPDAIRILAIANQSRRPFYWVRRTERHG